MIIRLMHGYVIRVMEHGWRLEAEEGKTFVGVYDFLTDAVNAASEHFARTKLEKSERNFTLAQASDAVTTIKAQFYAEMQGRDPEDFM